MHKVMEIKTEFGKVSVHRPLQPFTDEDERKLYAALIECLIEKKPKQSCDDQDLREKKRLAI